MGILPTEQSPVRTPNLTDLHHGCPLAREGIPLDQIHSINSMRTMAKSKHYRSRMLQRNIRETNNIALVQSRDIARSRVRSRCAARNPLRGQPVTGKQADLVRHPEVLVSSARSLSEQWTRSASKGWA